MLMAYDLLHQNVIGCLRNHLRYATVPDGVHDTSISVIIQNRNPFLPLAYSRNPYSKRRFERGTCRCAASVFPPSVGHRVTSIVIKSID